jgi:hypothetical protein
MCLEKSRLHIGIEVFQEQALGEKFHFLTNQFLVACRVQLAIDCKIIFISTNFTWPTSHLNLVDFSTRLVSVCCWPSIPIDHWFLFLINKFVVKLWLRNPLSKFVRLYNVDRFIILVTLFMDGWMLEILMDEVMFMFSTIV